MSENYLFDINQTHSCLYKMKKANNPCSFDIKIIQRKNHLNEDKSYTNSYKVHWVGWKAKFDLWLEEKVINSEKLFVQQGSKTIGELEENFSKIIEEENLENSKNSKNAKNSIPDSTDPDSNSLLEDDAISPSKSPKKRKSETADKTSAKKSKKSDNFVVPKAKKKTASKKTKKNEVDDPYDFEKSLDEDTMPIFKSTPLNKKDRVASVVDKTASLTQITPLFGWWVDVVLELRLSAELRRPNQPTPSIPRSLQPKIPLNPQKITLQICQQFTRRQIKA